METDGGGWTLAYNYGFTKYDTFNTGVNAVTPRPNWTASSANTPISNSAPLGDDSPGSIPYHLWKDISEGEFLIKSNINNWISCIDSNKAIATHISSSITCEIVNVLTSVCTTITPTTVGWNIRGAFLKASRFYYYWDGDTTMNWPTHDPCGQNSAQQIKGVVNPYGSIYLR